MPEKKTLLLPLQGLRGICYIIIFLGHAYRLWGWPTLAVSSFFMLSGFVLQYRYRGEDLPKDLAGCCRFAGARMAKIYGLHLFCTLVILALLGWQIGWLEALHREWGKLLLNVLLLQAWIPDPAWSISLNGASWYLSAALFLYFCFPRLSPLVSRLDKGRSLALAFLAALVYQLVLAGIMAVVFAGNKDFFNWSVYLFPVFRLGDFVAGCIGARFWELYGCRLSQLSGKFIYMGWLLAFALVFWSVSFVDREPAGILQKMVENWSTVFILPGICWILLGALGRGLPARFLAWGPLVKLGNLSGSTYLLHSAVLICFWAILPKYGIELRGWQFDLFTAGEFVLVLLLAVIWSRNNFFWHGIMVLCTLLLAGIYCSEGTYFYNAYQDADILFHMARLEGMAQGLEAGIFPVWINAFLLHGYGVPEGIMYPDTLLYPFALLRMYGFSLSGVYNAYWLFITLLAMGGSYYAYSHWLGSWAGGCAAALIYNSCYYCLFINGISLGACTAVAVYPLTLFGLWSTLQGNHRLWYWTVLGLCLILQSSLTGTLLILPPMAVLLLRYRQALREKPRRRALWLSVLFSLWLNLWRMVPVLDFYHRMVFRISDAQHYANGLFASFAHGTLSSQELLANGFMWGWPLVILTLAFALLRLPLWRQSRSWYGVFLLWLLITAGQWQGFPWHYVESLPLLGAVLVKFQFPFRFIHIGMIPLAYFLAKYLVELASRIKWGQVLLGGLCVFLACWSLYMTMFMEFHSYGMVNKPKFERRVVEEIDSANIYQYQDYLYADMNFDTLLTPTGAKRVGGREEIVTEAHILSYAKESSRITLAYQAEQDTVAELPAFFYHGYAGVLETGESVALGQTEEHIMTARLPAGSHVLTVWYQGTGAYSMANWLSLIGLAVFFWLLYRCTETP